MSIEETQNTSPPLLRVQDLSVSFRLYQGGLRQQQLKVMQALSLQLAAGEILALAGASGSGKSLLAHAILGLLPEHAQVGGSIQYRGEVLSLARQKQLRGREIALIPQSVNYLDPLLRVERQVWGRRPSPAQRNQQRQLFSQLGLAEDVAQLYPFQLSGGMARRVLVSTALVSEADLIIADEPTPGMSIDQALEALAILRRLADAGKAVLLITHDLDLAARFADRIAFFYAGTTLEDCAAADFQNGPSCLRHPYAKALWQALPQHGFVATPGTQPAADSLPRGCLFAPRCTQKTPLCEQNMPPLRALRGGLVRCFHAT